MSPHRIAIILALALCFSGCGPYLRAASTPPPTRTGDHVVNLFDDDEVKLSRGVAVAFDCVDGFTGRPCEASSITVADKSVARVYPGFLERGRDPWGYELAPRTGFVLAASAAGETTVSVSSETGTRTVRIIVE